MSTCRVLSSYDEPIRTAPVRDGTLTPLTGLTTVVLSIQRKSDLFWYDFNDDTFKSTGWTTRQQQMTEVSATLAAGEYYYNWDLSSITNAASDDTYFIRVDETGGTAKNTPMVGELKVDQWPDDILTDTSAIDARLPSDPADESNIQASIAALNDLSQADVQSAMTAQGYTAGRAPNLDNIDVTVSSRAAPGDAMTLTGAQLAALIDAVWDEDIVAAHGTADTAGLLLRVLGAALSQRTNNATLDALLGVPDSVGEDVPSAVDTELSGVHGAGSWEGSSDWSASEKEQIRYRLSMDGTQTDPTTGAGTLEDILADTDSLDTTKVTTARANNLDNLDAEVSKTLTVAKFLGLK